MLGNAWTLLRETVVSFIEDEALSRGAAIAFYAVTSLGPVLLVVVAVAGMAFGEDAARDAIVNEFRGLIGEQGAELLQTIIKSASAKSSGTLAGLVGLATLLVTTSGVFSEMQSALNAFWKADPEGTTVARLVRARIVSLGLVVAMGFLLLVSLVISAGLAAVSHYIDERLPFGSLVLQAINFVISLALIAILFAAIYKVLPDKKLEWRDVVVGAVATALLFNLGKLLVGLYIGSSAIASSYGAAGALIIVLLWIYYSAQIFLLGAEFTKAFARHHGSQRSGPWADERRNRHKAPSRRPESPASARSPGLTPACQLLAVVFLLRALLPIIRRRR